jgi:hypothetical protein
MGTCYRNNRARSSCSTNAGLLSLGSIEVAHGNVVDDLEIMCEAVAGVARVQKGYSMLVFHLLASKKILEYLRSVVVIAT